MTEPLRVSVVGAGAAGYYAVDELLRRDSGVLVDLIDRLPTPGGLVRSGVSPDHAVRRRVLPVYESAAVATGRFRYFGNVEVGRDVTSEELSSRYHAVIYATGASADQALGIPGEDLPGVHAATDLVGWYNGHPDHAERTFDLGAERVVVIGNGNVALDVARMLLLPVESLRRTDMADHALDALAHSRVREVVIVGRRGPGQVACSAPELLELGELPDVGVGVRPEDLERGSLLPSSETRTARFAQAARLGALRRYAEPVPPAQRQLTFRFFRAPLEILGTSHVEGVRLAVNVPTTGPDGSTLIEGTGEVEDVATTMVVRSIGYRGRPVPSVPFDPDTGRIPHSRGRVIEPSTGEPWTNAYVAGWIKRGPRGVIGSNKACARETVGVLLDDWRTGLLRAPSALAGDWATADRSDVFDIERWRRLDRMELAAGAAGGRPRQKIVDIDDMIGLT